MKNSDLQNRYVKKGQLFFLLSFVALILLGMLLLKIPGMYSPQDPKEGPLSWLNALFTSTSAVCVTGLAVRPISNFSFWGQLVILLLIQAGGLGIMTLTAYILLELGNGLSFGNSLMISNLNDKFSLRGTESFLRTVMIYTFVAEAVGFIAILPGVLCSDIDGFGFWRKLWGALFLSVSSFCNSGMTTFHKSLEGIHWTAQLPAALLAIFGGLGVYVIYDLVQVVRDRGHRLRVHSRLVLYTTGVLLIVGTVAIWSLSGGEWFDAFCFSVTSRTCGWNTAPMPAGTGARRFIMMLMLIGGSPGSTAGGIKTSTVALALMGIFSALRGDSETIVFKRRIPTGIVMRAQAIIILFALLSSFGATTLAQTEAKELPPGVRLTPLEEQMAKEKSDATAFEAVSALTTTGLSIGKTTELLTRKGRLLLVLFMFLGRVGPFTALLFLMGREKRGQIRYPEERVIIG